MNKRAFSLIELVIVIVIIGVIAAIAVPRLSRGSDGAGASALRGCLHTLRNAVEMYAAEHNGAWPGADKVEATLIDQLIKQTDGAGNVGNDPTVHIFGPYLHRGFPPISVGPNVGASEVHMKSPSSFQVTETASDVGWVYDVTTGRFMANTDDLDASGVGYDTY